MESPHGLPANVLPLPRWTVIIHIVQMVLAIIILGLDAYGIRWIAYNALIFSLVTALLTLGICAYILATSLFLHKLYNKFIVLAAHILMIIFWVVDLGLVANLARIWSGSGCSYSYYYGYTCDYVFKRDLTNLAKRETTTYKAYYGALAAGAFFGAMQFALWVLSVVFVAMYLNKHPEGQTVAHNPPVYTNDQAIPLSTGPEKFGQNPPIQPQPVYQQTSQPQYSQQQQQFPTYPQDPVSRQQTVSPISAAGYSQHEMSGNQSYNPNVSELSSPQPTGRYDPNAPELPAHK